MTKLTDLFTLGDLEMEIANSFVRERRHPHDPTLTILNYTERAQYDSHWNEVTQQCRGLIVNNVTHEILARPFDKFFNLGEYANVEALEPNSAVQVTDKMDGSLGILYPTPTEWNGGHRWAIATRGSFESEQAMHATAILWEKYPDFVPMPGWTYLFEIVYPENRIVLDYRDVDDLFLLGVRNIEDGKIYGPSETVGWPGPWTEIIHPYTTFARAVEQADRENREGIVVRFTTTDLMLKIKQEDYVRLHRIVTGLNEKVVWEHLSTHNGTYGELLDVVPDEFHDWVRTVAEAFLDAFETQQGVATWAYQQFDAPEHVLADMRAGQGRKDFALWARENHPGIAPLLFQLLDGRDISAAIWKNLKPRGETPSLLNRTEDVS